MRMSREIFDYFENELKDEYKAIGAAMGFGAGNPDTEDGPDAILPKESIIYSGLDRTKSITDITPANKKEERLLDFHTELGLTVMKTLAEGKKPFIIGGDHSIAIGSWSGLKQHLGKTQDFGLIWVDAHLDSHIRRTSPSQNLHGMPLAVLLGQSQMELSNLFDQNPKLKPENLFIIGARSYEEEEVALLKSLNVRVFYIDETLEKGFVTCFQEALDHFHKHNLPYGVSLDLDVFDPKYCDAFGTPEENGTAPKDFEAMIPKLSLDPTFKMMEIVEYNPHLDKEGKTKNVIKSIIQNFAKIQKA